MGQADGGEKNPLNRNVWTAKSNMSKATMRK